MKRIYLPLVILSVLLTGCFGTGQTEPKDVPPSEQPEAFPEDSQEFPLSEDSFPEEPVSAPADSFPEETSAEDSEADELAILADGITDSSMSEYEKVRAIHDYLVVHVDYDYENLAAGTLPDTAFTKEGALLLHSAVCEGYARAFSYLCSRAGLEELLVYGTADDGTGVQTHAWNQVRIDGEWYHVDVTWDDPLMNGKVITDGSNIIYEYFLVPDRSLLGSHTAESPEELHPCTSERYLEENRRLTIDPYLMEPFAFADTDEEVQTAVGHYLSESIHCFQVVCDVTSFTPENRSEYVLNCVKDTMSARGEYGQISVETQYGIADYAVIGVTITQ